MTTVLSKLMLLGMAPVLLMLDRVDFLGWFTTTDDGFTEFTTSISTEDELELTAGILLTGQIPVALSPAELSVLEAIGHD